MSADPCQWILDRIDALENEIGEVRARDGDANEVLANEIQIKDLTRQIATLHQMYRECQGHPPHPFPMTATIAGTLILRTSRSDHPGPFSAHLRVTLEFGLDNTRFSVNQGSTALGAVTILSIDGTGTFEQSTGIMNMVVTARINVSAIPSGLDQDATLLFNSPGLTTEKAAAVGPFSPQGSRYNSTTKRITLAGAATINDNFFLNGTIIEAELSGEMDITPPHPV